VLFRFIAVNLLIYYTACCAQQNQANGQSRAKMPWSPKEIRRNKTNWKKWNLGLGLTYCATHVYKNRKSKTNPEHIELLACPFAV